MTTQMDAVYIYGPTGRIAKKVNDMKEYYHTDQLGSTKLVTSENGGITEEIQYEPFGEQINASEERYTYNGKERDETGLYYYGARYYDPEMGKFLTRDPLPGDLLSPQTLNSYVYTLNNPLRYTDSQGMSTDEVPTYPDGTYSSVLTELYNKLQQVLNSMSAEDWAYIESLLNSTDANEKMIAVKTILFIGGFISKQQLISKDPLYITFGTMKFDFEFVDFEKGRWGDVSTNEAGTQGTIRLANHITKAGDLFLTLGHELIHAGIMGYQGTILKSVEQQYGEELKNVYVELTSYEWESSVMSEVPNTSYALEQTITYQHRIYSVWWNDPR